MWEVSHFKEAFPHAEPCFRLPPALVPLVLLLFLPLASVGGHMRTRHFLAVAPTLPSPLLFSGSKNVASGTQSAWHTQGVLWTPNRISFYLDGSLYFTTWKEQWYSSKGLAPYAPFDKPFYLIINLAMVRGANISTRLVGACGEGHAQVPVLMIEPPLACHLCMWLQHVSEALVASFLVPAGWQLAGSDH